MTSVTDRLRELGVELPEPAEPAFNYDPVARHGDLAYVSGQLPKEDGVVRITGRVGEDVDVETAGRAAGICALQGLAVTAAALGGIDRITRIVRVTGYVASGPDFHQQPKVLDAASDLFVEVFGEAGRHARSAVGVAELPRDAPVEVELIVAHDARG
ncbi:RidA family protein [Egibacter rhizosphaerae]|uniref:RidA family protein n=1 Tax=Egibacter rhizosphaerae TaxID=1670831 RepID=A0A411YHR4_9ACTN|nr:RidA family protein [Egibacter rhizosphaerae]QBI20808.1 RidA family protein [Egibacter rhizosphaerae]